MFTAIFDIKYCLSEANRYVNERIRIYFSVLFAELMELLKDVQKKTSYLMIYFFYSLSSHCYLWLSAQKP